MASFVEGIIAHEIAKMREHSSTLNKQIVETAHRRALIVCIF